VCSWYGIVNSRRVDEMSETTPRFWSVFFEVYEALPRQGPGSRACAAKALGLCRDLPAAPAVLDLGCGVGGQTLHLAGLTSGSIVALDSHAPSIERLRATVAERGLSARIRPVVGDMAHLEFPPGASTLSGPRGRSTSSGSRGPCGRAAPCSCPAATSFSPMPSGERNILRRR